jgi:hypothetical protein
MMASLRNSASLIPKFWFSLFKRFDTKIGGHHEQTSYVHDKFMQHVVSPTDTIIGMGNPFLDMTSWAFATDTKTVKAIRSAENLGCVEPYCMLV